MSPLSLACSMFLGMCLSLMRRNGQRHSTALVNQLSRWFTGLMIIVFLASCGGGGDGGPPPPPPPPSPSKAFVADSGQAVIGSSANSKPAPGPVPVDRIIRGANTMLTGNLFDLALDVANDRLYVSDLRSILVFNNTSTASGNVAPSRIVSQCCVMIGNFMGIYLDSVHDRLYAAVNLDLATRQVHVTGSGSPTGSGSGC